MDFLYFHFVYKSLKKRNWLEIIIIIIFRLYLNLRIFIYRYFNFYRFEISCAHETNNTTNNEIVQINKLIKKFKIDITC